MDGARRAHATSKPGLGRKKKFQGEFAKGSLAGHDCIFLRPETFMNESGRSVQPAMGFFHVAPREVIVLHDELDVPFGEVRVKFGGGHAGHNGLRSLVSHLGTADFIRVRMGIGRPPAGFTGDVADYVLSSFDPMERALFPTCSKGRESGGRRSSPKASSGP